MSIIDPQYTKNLVLKINNDNEVSPSDASLIVVKRPTFVLPLMPNREVKIHDQTSEGKYINSLFNKHTINSHMGLSFYNILTEMIRENSYTWSLSFLRSGRDLTKYIDFSFIDKDVQTYEYFNFNSNQTIYLHSTSFYMVINSSAKTLTFHRTSLQFVKESMGSRISSVVLRMKFKVLAEELITI